MRNQLSLLNSLYGQRIKSFKMVHTFDRHTQIYRGRRLFDYEELLRPWYADDSLEFKAVPFTGSHDVDPLQQLLQIADIDAVPGTLLVSEEKRTT